MLKNNLYNIGIKGAASIGRVWQFVLWVYDLVLAGGFSVIMAIPGVI